MEQTAQPDERAVVQPESSYVLSVVSVYQDALTREWVAELCDRVTHLVGRENIHCRSWEIGELARPEILSDAVRFAALADVVVVSLYAAEELPLDLYAWIDVWLPRRGRRAGALIALIGVSEQSGRLCSRTRDYLKAVARRGRLDFMPRELSGRLSTVISQ